MDRIQELAKELVELRQRGRVIVHAANVEEGIGVAARLRDLGKAQWFRGQVKNHPKLTPLLHRLSKAKFAQAERAIQRFDYWIRSTPGLEEIAASTDAIIAVAQHYGMPTSFLDFTTEPRIAGYFASVTKEPPVAETVSCIYCLDIEEADDIWQCIPGNMKSPERLVLDVPNLWRLEAQKGAFVFCPYDDLNGPFPIDRIDFTYQGPVSAPSDEEIYPRESRLEARVREYFQSEEIMNESIIFEEIRRHISLTNITFDGQSVRHELFATPPTAHPSWSEAQVRKWLTIGRVQWSDVQRASKLSFKVNLSRPLFENVVQFEDFVRSRLQNKTTPRKSIVWRISIEEYNDQTIDRLNAIFQRIWDNMAGLPWTEREIMRSLSAALKFFLTQQQVLHEDEDLIGRELERERETARRVLAWPLRVQLGGRENIHTFAWVDEDDLLAAVRLDFKSLLRPESRDRILANTFNLLMAARSPSLLFDFAKLSALFAEQMIPTQAVFYPNHPLFPTPARVEVIGPE